MFTQTLVTTLRLLVFRAGPEDLPFDASHRLTLACVTAAIVANTLFAGIVESTGYAVVSAVMNVVLIALATRGTLAVRGLLNRFQQTFNALMLTTTVLTLVMVPFLMKLAPVLGDLQKRVQANPDLLAHPELLPQPPAGPVLMLMLLLFWQFVVTGRIFYRAAGARALIVLAVIVVSFMLLLRLSASGV